MTCDHSVSVSMEHVSLACSGDDALGRLLECLKRMGMLHKRKRELKHSDGAESIGVFVSRQTRLTFPWSLASASRYGKAPDIFPALLRDPGSWHFLGIEFPVAAHTEYIGPDDMFVLVFSREAAARAAGGSLWWSTTREFNMVRPSRPGRVA